MPARSIKKVPAFIERYNVVVGSSGMQQVEGGLEEVDSKPYT